MHTIDQGTVIYGFRSEKYPEKACYGIIISARCDIANCKVRRLYYLIAVDAAEWLISDAGFEMATKAMKNAAKEGFCNEAKKFQLNGEDLLSFDYEQMITVIKAEVDDKQAKNLLEKYQKYSAYICETEEERRGKISANAKKIKDFLRDVNNGVYTHLYYLPEVAYKRRGTKAKGLIVDLQEIEAISIADAEAICQNKVDNLILKPKEREHFARFCWIEDTNCYTGIDSLVQSPWCEHLMQRFANGFVRIGLDGPLSDDFNELVNTI